MGVKIHMDTKPIHYDGSNQNNETPADSIIKEPFILTDDMRINLSGNPYLNGTIE